MDEVKGSAYMGPRPPASSLGAWLLTQVRDLKGAIAALSNQARSDRDQVTELRPTVDRLIAKVEGLAKVQAIRDVELEQLKLIVDQTQRQLSGLKISKGMHRARVQRLLQDMERRLN